MHKSLTLPQRDVNSNCSEFQVVQPTKANWGWAAASSSKSKPKRSADLQRAWLGKLTGPGEGVLSRWTLACVITHYSTKRLIAGPSFIRASSAGFTLCHLSSPALWRTTLWFWCNLQHGWGLRGWDSAKRRALARNSNCEMFNAPLVIKIVLGYIA